MMRIIRSAISGWTSTSHGNLERIAIAGFKAPTEKRAMRIPVFWFEESLGSGVFLNSDVGVDFSLGGAEDEVDSRGAAMAN